MSGLQDRAISPCHGGQAMLNPSAGEADYIPPEYYHRSRDELSVEEIRLPEGISNFDDLKKAHSNSCIVNLLHEKFRTLSN